MISNTGRVILWTELEFQYEKKYVGWKEEIAGNRKIENTLFLVKLFIFGIIVKKTLLKISKVRLYYIKKKKNLFPSILTKLFFFPIFTRNKLLTTRRRICNFQFFIENEYFCNLSTNEVIIISFVYLEKINNRKMKFLRDIQRRRNIDLLLSFFRMIWII